jgi:hypothetical protein
MKVLLGRWTLHYRLRISTTAVFCSYSSYFLTPTVKNILLQTDSWFLRYAVTMITHRATKREVTEHSKGKGTVRPRTGHEGPEEE